MSSDCPVCRSQDVQPDATMFRLCRCQRCSARWLDAVPPSAFPITQWMQDAQPQESDEWQ